MNILRGLLSKMLLLVLVVAIMALVASYTFVSIQQQQTLDENIQSIKQSHLRASRLLFANAMQQQILAKDTAQFFTIFFVFCGSKPNLYVWQVSTPAYESNTTDR